MTSTSGTRLLVLGGTGFVGPAVIDDARARGWDVTVFNRGNRPAPGGVTVLRGDRTAPGGLTTLDDGGWDVAVDTWAAAPAAVRDASALLADRVDRYVYVSSRSVYRYPMPAGAHEDQPVVDASPDDGGDVAYARAKAGAETAAVAAFGDRALLARAGLILGPREDVGRLPWWLGRIARGGRVLAPGPPDADVQFVDVRDLAAFMLDAAEGGLAGAFDLVCPVGHATLRDVLDACVSATGSGAELRWTTPDRILEAGVEPWTDLPIWLPPGEAHDAMHRSDVTKAVAAGLRCRPVVDTVADTWAWLETLDAPPAPPRDLPPVGLDADTEADLLSVD
jgi:nucleoside-diphosphate-sugar epimerase